MVNRYWKVALTLVLSTYLFSCNPSSTSGGSGGGGGNENSARIAGSVTLSSSVAGSNKPSAVLQKSSSDALQYKVTADSGVQILNKPVISSALSAVSLMNVGDPVGDAWVYLYDAEHPEWLAPVAQDVTSSSGEYLFESYGCTDDVDVLDCAPVKG